MKPQVLKPFPWKFGIIHHPEHLAIDWALCYLLLVSSLLFLLLWFFLLKLLLLIFKFVACTSMSHTFSPIELLLEMLHTISAILYQCIPLLMHNLSYSDDGNSQKRKKKIWKEWSFVNRSGVFLYDSLSNWQFISMNLLIDRHRLPLHPSRKSHIANTQQLICKEGKKYGFRIKINQKVTAGELNLIQACMHSHFHYHYGRKRNTNYWRVDSYALAGKSLERVNPFPPDNDVSLCWKPIKKNLQAHLVVDMDFTLHAQEIIGDAEYVADGIRH